RGKVGADLILAAELSAADKASKIFTTGADCAGESCSCARRCKTKARIGADIDPGPVVKRRNRLDVGCRRYTSRRRRVRRRSQARPQNNNESPKTSSQRIVVPQP